MGSHEKLPTMHLSRRHSGPLRVVASIFEIVQIRHFPHKVRTLDPARIEFQIAIILFSLFPFPGTHSHFAHKRGFFANENGSPATGSDGGTPQKDVYRDMGVNIYVSDLVMAALLFFPPSIFVPW